MTVPAVARGPGVLVATSAVLVAWWLRSGVGPVLDDWYYLGQIEVDGLAGAGAGKLAGSRPGSALVHMLTFGWAGGRPGVGLALALAGGGATAVVGQRVLGRFVGSGWATVVAVLWLVLPNHTALEAWLACLPIGVAALLVVSAAERVTAGPWSARRWGVGLGLVVAASLTYEAAAPAGFVLLLAGPRLVGSSLPARAVLVAVATGAAVAGWLVGFRDPDRVGPGWAPLGDALGGHLGRGVLAGGPLADAMAAAAMLGVLVCVVRSARPGLLGHAGAGDRLVVAGVVVAVLGVLPYARYFYLPIGAGDRAHGISAIGGALVWTGLAMVVATLRPGRVTPPVVLVSGLLVGGLVARVDRMDNWSTAAADGRRIASEVAARWPEGPPDRYLVLGPEPVQHEGVAALLDPSSIDGMLRLLYGEAGWRTAFAAVEADFATVPLANRLDIDPLSRLGDEGGEPGG